MLRPTVAYSFLRVLFCLFVLSFFVGLFQVSCRLYLCQVVIQMMMTPCFVLFQECAVLLLVSSFFFSFSISIYIFAFGLNFFGASRSCCFCASFLMLSTAIVSLSSIVIAPNDAFAFAFFVFDALISFAIVSGV